MDSADVLYFAHIPKTAGTSVTAALDAEFVDGAILPASFSTELEAARPAFARAQFARGHLGAGVHDVLGRGGPTFTLLRSPLERTLSHIAQVQRHPFHPLHDYVVDRGHDVAGFVRDPLLRPYIANFQARHLVQPAGTAAAIPPTLVPAGHPAAGQVAYELAVAGDEATLLATASRALAATTVVGTTDDVDGALQCLATVLGWRRVPRAERRNTTPEPIDPAAIDAGIRDEILALNTVDQALYDLACEPPTVTPPRTWAWHPWRTTGDGWEPAEFDAHHGWYRRIGASGEAHAVLDGPDGLGGSLSPEIELAEPGDVTLAFDDASETVVVRGKAGLAVKAVHAR